MTQDLLDKISAYIDGELPEAEIDTVQNAIDSDPEAQAALSSLRAVKDRLGALSRPAAKQGFAERLQARLTAPDDELLDAAPPKGVIKFPRAVVASVLSAAAAVTITIGAMMMIDNDVSEPPASDRVTSMPPASASSNPNQQILASPRAELNKLRWSQLDYVNGELIRIDTSRRKNRVPLDDPQDALQAIDSLIHDYVIWLQLEKGISVEAVKAKLAELSESVDPEAYIEAYINSNPLPSADE